MTRRQKRRQMRRMLAGLFAGAAVLVPSASAVVVHDDPADRAPQQSVIPYLSQGEAAIPGLTGDEGAQALVRGDGPDGAVARAELRRDGSAASQEPYTTAATQSGGSEFDWAASGIGAGSAALLLMLGYAAFRLSARGSIARA